MGPIGCPETLVWDHHFRLRNVLEDGGSQKIIRSSEPELLQIDRQGRPRRTWVDNIRMDLREVGCGYMDWIGLAQDRDG